MMRALPATALKLFLRALIRFYQIVISPAIGPRCRFAPTCSEYAMEAIALHGPFTGVWLAARRLLRCHPWGGSGFDPVPPHLTAVHPHSSACGCGHAQHTS